MIAAFDLAAHHAFAQSLHCLLHGACCSTYFLILATIAVHELGRQAGAVRMHLNIGSLWEEPQESTDTCGVVQCHQLSATD